MLRRPLYSTPRLVRQHFARNRYAIHGHHVQLRRTNSSNASTDSDGVTRSRRTYSAEEDEIILRMRARNESWESIASCLPGRSPAAVKIRFTRYLLIAKDGQPVATIFQQARNENKEWTAEELAMLSDMLKKGFKLKAVAQNLGRTWRSVQQKTQRLSLQPDSGHTATSEPAYPRRRWAKAEDDQLLRLSAMGVKFKAIASEMGRSTESVRNRRRIYFPYTYLDSNSDPVGSKGAALRPTRTGLYERWTRRDDERVIELYTNGTKKEQIASELGRTVGAVASRWYDNLKHRVKNRRHIGGPSDGEQKQRQQTANNVSQPNPQSRRNFTTLHCWKPHLATNLQKQSSALTYSSHRVVGTAPWKRRGDFSLPYRPQQRFEHTKSAPSSQTRKRVRRLFSDEETLKILELRAAQYPWVEIAKIVGRQFSSVRTRVLSSLKEERWRQRFEAAKAALPDDQTYYGSYKDQIKRRRSARYSVEEHERIIDLRAQGKTWEEIGEIMNRNAGRIRTIANSLLKEEQWVQRFEAAKSSPRGKGRFITPEEDAVILSMRKAGNTWQSIAKALGRPATSVITRWKRALNESDPVVREHTARLAQQSFGKLRRHFTAEEDRRLLHMASLGTKQRDMSTELGRNLTSIAARLRLLRLKESQTPIKRMNEPWSEAERQRLRLALSNAKDVRELEQLFPSRTLDSLKNMCRVLKLPVAEGFYSGSWRWTPAQDAELLRLKEAGQSYKAIGAILGKDSKACRTRWVLLQEASSQ
ncbi:hypothetical protein Q7P35_006462 [Cladosporium inversicolor]